MQGLLVTINCSKCFYVAQACADINMILRCIQYHAKNCGTELAVEVVKVELPKTFSKKKIIKLKNETKNKER